MERNALLWLVVLSLFMAGGPVATVSGQGSGRAAAEVEAGLRFWLASVDAGLAEAESAAAAGDAAAGRAVALRVYLDHFELIEAYYGPGGPHATPKVSARIAEVELRFHELLRGEGEPGALAARAALLRSELATLEASALEAGVPLNPSPSVLASGSGHPGGEARTPEIRAILALLEDARVAYVGGDAGAALALVEDAYLNIFEPLEARLPGAVAGQVERAIHIGLRPALAGTGAAGSVAGAFGAVESELMRADEALTEAGGFWFGAFNAFAIILREGLEAVLLVGALLAYLGASRSSTRHRRHIYMGVGVGVAASIATWLVARTLIPISGAGRELVEGVTGLAAVAVLLYVSNWLAQKTYIQDWKTFLQEKVDAAASAGSTFAMAGLAFAAVYREGFETVLFYHALLFDTGVAAVLAGFVPGMLLILGLGMGIIRLGLSLPLRRVFTVTNAILVYLAFTFLGKSLYNLQEAGLFAPFPVAWFPDIGWLRQLFGLYPVAETLLAQAAFLVVVGATYMVYRRAAGRSAARLPLRSPQGAAPSDRAEARTRPDRQATAGSVMEL